MGDDDQDPIVSRLNVFLSKRLGQSLLLLQYPVRTASKTYDDANIVTARVKPRQHCVELEVAVDIKGHWSGLSGDPQMNKMKLTSSPSGAEMHRYVIGVVNNGELHVTPLNNVVQMRPSYNYLDNAESKAAQGVKGATGAGESSQDEGEDESRPVTVRFAPHESEDALARRMASYEHFKRQVDEESWVNVRHCPVDSYESHMGRLQLIAEKKLESTEFYLPPPKYLNKLIPSQEAEVSAVASLPSNILSLAALKAMPRDERIKALMKSVRAIRFTELLAVLKSLGEQQSISSLEFIQDVLRHVQHCAVLIQGCWVAKSEMLYAKDSVSDQTGASSNVLRSARDYILYRFHQDLRADERVVTRRDVAENVAPLSTEDEREILDKIARRSALKRGWEFRFERDVDFLTGEYYRHVSKTQESYWQKQDAHWQKLQATKKQTTSSSNSPTKPKRQRARTKSVGIDRSMSDQSESDADVSVRMDEQGSSVIGDAASAAEDCTIVSATINHRTAAAMARKSIASQGGTTGDVDVLSLLPLLVKTEPVESIMQVEPDVEPDVMNEDILPSLTEFAGERLRSHSVLSISSLRNQLDVYRTSLPVGHVLGLAAGIASLQHLLDQALINCGAVRASFNNERGGTETVYMLQKRGDDRDSVRRCLVELLSAQKTFKITTLKKYMQTMNCDVECSDNDLRNIVREYCVSTGGSWTLKETWRTTTDT